MSPTTIGARIEYFDTEKWLSSWATLVLIGIVCLFVGAFGVSGMRDCIVTVLWFE